MGRVSNKVAIVTGGASGIGKTTARILFKEGSQVVITDLMAEEGERSLRSLAGRAFLWSTM